MNRASASWELIKNDRVSTSGQEGVIGHVWDGVTKAHDAISNAIPSLLTLIDQNSYEVVDRASHGGPLAGTIQSIRSTLKARVFPKGNILNLPYKAIVGLMAIPDGALSDALHRFEGGNGSVLRTAA